MTSTSAPPKPMPPRAYLAVIRTIDKFTEWTGYLFVLFIIPLIFANVIEVFATRAPARCRTAYPLAAVRGLGRAFSPSDRGCLHF